MIKALQKVGVQGIYLNIIKAIYNKPTANIILNSEKLKAFPLKSGTKPILTTFIQHSFASSSHSSQTRKRNRRNPNWNERSKTVTVLLYVENPKDATIKLPELNDEFGKVAGYKINIQKSVAFLYTNNELSEKEIKTFPFIVALKRINT